MGHYSLWVVHQRPDDHPKHFVVRHWQVTDTGKIRTASEPRILADTLLEARAVIPYGLLRVQLGVPDLKIIEIWF
jgi:hypothetical protein